MSAAIQLRNDFDGSDLRMLAKATKNAAQGRRLLALAEIYDGGSRTDAARIGGVGLQTVRDWVLRFNARGPDGLINGKAPGNPSKLNDDQRRALAAIVESGPIPAVHGVVPLRRAQEALVRSGGMDLGGVPHRGKRDDGKPGTEGTRLCQVVGSSAPLRPERRGDGGL